MSISFHQPSSHQMSEIKIHGQSHMGSCALRQHHILVNSNLLAVSVHSLILFLRVYDATMYEMCWRMLGLSRLARPYFWHYGIMHCTRHCFSCRH